MASAVLFRPPDPFSYDTLQNMITNWRTWQKQFNIFLTATKYADEGDPVKVSMFLNLIGPQGVDLYDSFTWAAEADNLVYKKVIEKFEAHMNKNKNITVNRYAFFNSDQKEGQTIEDYIKELTLLRKDCDFQSDTNINDSLLRDKIISGLNDTGLKEKLLRLGPDQSNLATVISTCRMHEISKDHSTLLEKDSDSYIQMVRQPSTHSFNRRNNGKYGNYGNNRRSTAQQPAQASTGSRMINCKFCGVSHEYGNCNAFGKQCGYCNRLHHFESVCYKKKRHIRKVENSTDDDPAIHDEVNSLSH